MKWLGLFLLCSSFSYSQVFIQTFTDRCTGETTIIQIPFEGTSTVVFYNKSRTVTAADFTSGELQAWMEEVYAWWRSLSPCSTNQATTTAATTATTNATQNATSSTTGATASAASPPATESAPATTETTTNDQPQAESTEEAPETTSEESSTEETSSEDDGGGSEEEGTEEDNGDDSDDGEESEEEGGKQQRKSNPIVVAANVATMSALDGSVNAVLGFGLSQASLSGHESYSANLMAWDNLKQFNLSLGKSYIQKEPTVTLYHYRKDGSRFGTTTGGAVENIQTSSVGFMYMFGSITLSYGKSIVWPLKKGLIAGTGVSLMYANRAFIPLTLGFATKPFAFDRITVSPMLAIASTPVIYINRQLIVNKSAMVVFGSSNDFNLTKNFRVNLGWNIVKSTTNLPMTWSINIGSRFQF